MMKRVKCILLLFSMLPAMIVDAQSYKKNIISSFDKIDYYPDSAIKCAYKIENGVFNGYAIEFDSTGRVSAIGIYKNGKKDGYWQSVNNNSVVYKNGTVKRVLGIPGCGTGRMQAGVEFHNLYIHLINAGDTLDFCSAKYPIPADCTLGSYGVKCADYSMSWIYMDKSLYNSMTEQIVAQMQRQLKDFKKQAIICYLSGNEVKGYTMSFKKDHEMRYELIAYGIVNEQPVFFRLSLTHEVKTNEDIPKFPRMIIRLTK